MTEMNNDLILDFSHDICIPRGTQAAARTARLVWCVGMEINYRVTTAHPASTGPAELQ